MTEITGRHAVSYRGKHEKPDSRDGETYRGRHRKPVFEEWLDIIRQEQFPRHTGGR
jgi:hypothetical protein